MFSFEIISFEMFSLIVPFAGFIAAAFFKARES